MTLQVLLSILSGASLLHEVGFLDCADIGSLALLVATDEIIGMARRIQRGIDIRPQTLMMDLVGKVGPGGNFLGEEESSSQCRAEIWAPKLLDRNPLGTWEQMGRQSLEDRVQEKLLKILRESGAAPLEAGVLGKIDRILQEAEAREARAA